MGFLEKRLKKRLNDPEFKKEWERSELEYQVARQIIKIRKELGYTQKQVAQMLDTKQSAISRIENGDQNMTLAMMNSVAKALGGHVKITIETDQEQIH